MARDYARYTSPPKKKLAEKGWRKRLLFSVAVGCMLGIIFYGIYIYKNHLLESSQQQLMTWVASMQSRQGHKKRGASLLAKIPSVPQSASEPEVLFNFYTELPNRRVILSESEETVHVPALATQHAVLPSAELKKNKNETENTGHYILQLGVYQNETAAGQLRVSLLLAGCDVDIVQYTEKNKTALYRVQKGPYATLSEVKRVQKQLQSKGVVGLIKAL